MFVAHEPKLCFDVFRQNDRCVCGASALMTHYEAINNGYCETCAKKEKNLLIK